MALDSPAYDWPDSPINWMFQHHKAPYYELWTTKRFRHEWPRGFNSWLWNTFGPPGPKFIISGAPDDYVRPNPPVRKPYIWDYHNGTLFFHDAKCVTMILLRWA